MRQSCGGSKEERSNHSKPGASRRWIPTIAAGLVAISAFLMPLGGRSYAAKSVTLANGLEVIAEEMRVSPLVAVSVLYKVGSRNEVSGHTGVSHFVEHMLFNGTQKYPADKATKEILKNGGIPIGETWWDYTHFGAVLPSDKIDLALDIEADRMANATVDSEAVNEERDVILEELAMRGEAPVVVLIEDLFASAFKVHPYHHWMPGGYSGDVENMEPEYVQKFYKEHYNPANAVVTVVGDIGEDEAIAKVRQYFEGVPGGTKRSEVMPEEPAQLGLRRVVVRGTANEGRILVFFKGPAYASRDYEVSSVLATLLGSGRSSILTKKLVDTGVATDVGVILFPSIDPFGFLLMASVAKDHDMKACEKAIYKAIEEFKTAPPEEAVIARTRTRTEGLTVLGRQTVKDRAFELGSDAVRGDWRYADQFVRNIQSVTPVEVSQVAAKYLSWDRATIGWLVPSDAKMGNEDLIGGNAAVGLPVAISELFSPPASGGSPVGSEPPKHLTFVDAEVTSLPSGVTIITKEDHSLPIVAFSVSITSGCAYEPEGKSGLALLAAKAVAMGSADYPYRDLYDKVEALGSDISVRTDMERAYLSTAVLSAHSGEAAKIVCDLVTSPAFRGMDFARAKRELLSQISQTEEDATEVGLRKFRELYYAGHPYSRAVEGRTDAVRRLSAKDVKSFYGNAWLPGRTVVAVVGDFQSAEMKQALTGLLSGWRGRDKGRGSLAIPPLQIKPGYSQYVETMPDKKQAKIFWGMRAPAMKDPQFDSFQVMNFIFGGQAFGSRLFDRIREKESLAYVVTTQMDLTSQPGALYVYLGTRPRNVEAAVDAVRQEISRIRTDGVTDEEMDLTKNFLKSLMPFRMQTYSEIAAELLNMRFYDLPADYYDTYGDRIAKVTKQEVLDAAMAYLTPDNSCLVVVGPVDKNMKAVSPTLIRTSKEHGRTGRH